MAELDITNALVIIALGLAATLAAALVLYVMQWAKMIDVNVIAAMGSVFTRQRSKYLRVGWTVHIVVGVLFSFLYIAAWNALGVTQPLAFTVLGAVIGALHGILVSYFLAIFVGEHHRLRRLRGGTGFGIAVAQWGAHVVYGFTLGLAAAVYFWMRGIH